MLAASRPCRIGPALLFLLFCLFGILATGIGHRSASAAIENLVWVAGEPGNVVRVDLGGGRQKLLASPSGASGVAIDASGTAYVAAATGLFVIDSRGETRAVHPGAGGARSIVVDAAGDLWLTTPSAGGSVQKWTPDGERVLAITGMRNPTGIAADAAGGVWVVDSHARTLTRIDAAGARRFIVSGGGCEGAVAIDREGHAWVADACGSGRLLRYSLDGNLVSSHSVPGVSIGPIGVDGLGQVWVGHPLERMVTVLSPSGDLAHSIGVSEAPIAIAVDGLGIVWVIGASSGILERFEPRTGAPLGSFTSDLRSSARGDLTGFTLANVTMPDADFDGDGYPNAEEIAAGANPFSSESLPQAFLAGNVNARLGAVTDVLFVNDQAGGARRTVSVTSYQPITVHVGAPPAARGPSGFVLFARHGATAPREPTPLPNDLGEAAFPMPLSGRLANTVTLANSLSPMRRRRLGEARLDSGPAPVTVGMRRTGLGRRASFTLQGLIEDPGSLGPGVSVTNAVFVRVE